MNVSRPVHGLLSCAGLLLFTLACTSTGVDKTRLSGCECGTPKADTMGCTAECTLSDGAACENPECTCEHEGAFHQPPAEEKGGK